MTIKRSARMTFLICASVACLGLAAGASTAAAKAKVKVITKTAFIDACFNVGFGIPDWVAGQPTGPASLREQVEVPNFRGNPQDGVVTRVSSANVRITHTDDGDLVLGLISPAGKLALLANTRDDAGLGSGGDGYGTGPADCTGSLVQFSDDAALSITAPGNTGINTPINGSFRPEQPLSSFVGGPASGDWSFFVLDTVGGNTGTIDAVSLNLSLEYKAIKKKKKTKKR